jgi:hypothetical protein
MGGSKVRVKEISGGKCNIGGGRAEEWLGCLVFCPPCFSHLEVFISRFGTLELLLDKYSVVQTLTLYKRISFVCQEFSFLDSLKWLRKDFLLS